MTSSPSALLTAVVELARASGGRLLSTFSTDSRPTDRDALIDAVRHNEDTSIVGVREGLLAMRPDAGWVTDSLATTALPAGDWWVVDAVEGNVNHIHGMSDWCVSIALVHDGATLLAVVHQPVPGLTYTAVRGGGAYLNGVRLQSSKKASLEIAIAATGQAEAGQSDTYQRIGGSIATMLGCALLVQCTVPSTFPMLRVASGQNDVFWQYRPTLPGVAAGILFIEEAGGIVSRIDGGAWVPGSADILATAPLLHSASVEALRR